MKAVIIPALVVIFSAGASSLYLETFHSGIWKVPEDIQHSMDISLRFNTSQGIDGDPIVIQEKPGALLVVTAIPDEDWKLDFVNSSAVFTAEEVLEGVIKNITFSGYYWGFTHISFYLTRNDLDPDFQDQILLKDDLEIVIDRGSMTINTVFVVIGAIFVLFNNSNMGAQLNLQVIKKVLKKPLGPLCGFLSQFIFMPTITWMMGKALFSDPLQRLGLFTYGCSPGGTSSNFWTLMFNGDINLSLTMTAISTIAAMGMMPLWMFTLGSSLLEENNDLKIPFGNLAIGLVTLTIPVLIGITIRLKKPNWADTGRKIIKPFTLFMLIFFMTIGTYNSYKVVVMMTWQMVVASLLTIICGYTLGAVFARIMCLPRAQVIAVSIETALQNSSVGFILLKLSLGSPYSDLASVPIISSLFMSGPPLILMYLFYLMAKRFCGCCPDDLDDKDPPQELEGSPEEASFLEDVEGDNKRNQEIAEDSQGHTIQSKEGDD